MHRLERGLHVLITASVETRIERSSARRKVAREIARHRLAEGGDERTLTKENVEQSNSYLALSRGSGPTGLDRVREAASGIGSCGPRLCCTM